MITRVQETGYVLPAPLYARNQRTPDVSSGDREALSMLIAAYSFSSNLHDCMRFVSAFAATLQGYLVKAGRYAEYQLVFRDIGVEIGNARILLDSPRDAGQCGALLYHLETALRVIAEREGLTQTSVSMYEGKMPISPSQNPLPDGDLYMP